MPICPGCEQKVSYTRLDVHQRYCDGIQNSEVVRRHVTERFEHRLRRLEERIDVQTERALERQLTVIEGEGSSSTTGEDE